MDWKIGDEFKHKDVKVTIKIEGQDYDYFWCRFSDGGENKFTEKKIDEFVKAGYWIKKEKDMTHSTEEKILKAAKTSLYAKEALAKLYPDLFPKDLSVFIEEFEESSRFFRRRTKGEYAFKSFYLIEQFNWKIKKDNLGKFCLIPTLKD